MRVCSQLAQTVNVDPNHLTDTGSGVVPSLDGSDFSLDPTASDDVVFFVVSPNYTTITCACSRRAALIA